MGNYRNLKVYKVAYQLAMDVFNISKSFPREEKWSLTDQIRRSSRSICSNIVEGYRKRQYPRHFGLRLSDADAECSETIVWLDFAQDCNYITKDEHTNISARCEEIGKMLGSMILHPEKFQ